jgi:pSer/pThr/pTyr-binding forkhead associated (FHA) protein
VVVEPDHRWFERNEAEGTTGAVPFPEDTSPLQLTLTGDEVLVGRRSDTRTAQPDVEVEDPGVSRRHALLRRQPDGGWVIVDEQSTNGTWIDVAVDPIPAGETVPLTDGATVHIGAFTRLTIRRA